MRRQVSTKVLFLLCSLGTLALAVGFAYYAVPDLVRTRLAAGAADRAIQDAVAAARQAILLGGALAFIAALLLSLGFGALVGHALRQVRNTAVRVFGAPDRRSMPSFVLVELDLLASALDRAAHDLDRRVRGAARERDDAARLLDSVGEGILQLSPGGRIVRVNRAAVELLKLPEDDTVRDRPFTSFIRQAPLRELLTRAARGEPVLSREVRIEDRRVLVAANPLRGGSERSGAVAVFVDLTELRRLEGVRRDFVANASHELKTPLTSIRGYSETLLQDDVPDDLRRQFLESVFQNADRLHRIVEDLLDLSRLESGNWAPDYEEVDAARIAEEVWHGFAERAKRVGVAFEIERDYDSPLPADRVALAQIFSNLYDNALRHTSEGESIRVRITSAPCRDVDRERPAVAVGAVGLNRLERAAGAANGVVAGTRGARSPDGGAGGDDCVLIEVADTGAGIPIEAIDRIFERFYRVDPARSRAEGGTGLGLAIVKHLVESMGGRVAVDSALGTGTRMRITLPPRRPQRSPGANG